MHYNESTSASVDPFFVLLTTITFAAQGTIADNVSCAITFAMAGIHTSKRCRGTRVNGYNESHVSKGRNYTATSTTDVDLGLTLHVAHTESRRDPNTCDLLSLDSQARQLILGWGRICPITRRPSDTNSRMMTVVSLSPSQANRALIRPFATTEVQALTLISPRNLHRPKCAGYGIQLS